MSLKVPGRLTDSTTGTVGQTINDTTLNVLDDLASIAAKVNALVDVVKALAVGGPSVAVPGKLTDSTTGAVGQTCDDTTASIKDDLACLIAKVNLLIDAVKALEAGSSITIPGKLTDSTGGAVGQTCDATTANTKDDLAAIIAKVNGLIDVVTVLQQQRVAA